MLLKDLLSKFEGLDPETTEIFLSDNTTQMTAVGISEEMINVHPMTRFVSQKWIPC